MKIRSAFAAMISAIALAIPAGARAADPIITPIAHIQPGAPMTDPTQFPDDALPYSFHRCTMGFILADHAGTLYVVTAGHCVARKGVVTFDESGRPVGRVVFRMHSGTDDMALVRIFRARYPDVNPSVRDWGGPTGVATPATAKPLDQVRFSGFSFALGDIPQTRFRTGILVKQDAVHYMAETSASEGDSGAPFIDTRTGEALGIVRDFGLTDKPPVTDDGPTLERILQLLSNAGFRLRLETAPYYR